MATQKARYIITAPKASSPANFATTVANAQYIEASKLSKSCSGTRPEESRAAVNMKVVEAADFASEKFDEAASAAGLARGRPVVLLVT